MRSVRHLALFALAAPLAAQSPPKPVITTVGGVQQIRYPAGALAAAPKFRLSPAPMATMGGAGAPVDAELTTMLEPRLLPDGRVVAFDQKEKHFIVFSPSGKLEKTIGRGGGGPREFKEVQPWMGVAGDTVIASDSPLGKLVLLHPTRGVLREIPLKAPLVGFFFSPIGAMAGRFAFAPTEWVLPPVDTATRRRGPVICFDPRSNSIDTLFTIGGPTVVPLSRLSNGKTFQSMTTLTFAEADWIAASPEGFVVAPNGAFLLEYRNAAGVLTRRVTVAGLRRPVTAAIRESTIDRIVQRNGGPGDTDVGGSSTGPGRQEIKRDTRFADSLPAIGRIAAQADGSVWVLDFALGDVSPWSATLFNGAGGLLGRVEGKRGERPIAWLRDRVVVESRDGDGVITWRIYQVLGIPAPVGR
jgi:hypothetical protein